MLKWRRLLRTAPPMAPTTPIQIPDDWRLWPLGVLHHRDWFRQAPEELMLIDALTFPGKYAEVLDREAWFAMMLPLLCRVRVASLRAANFEFEPEPYQRAWLVHDDYVLYVSDSPGGAHRAVRWEHPAPGPRRLWIDGHAIVPPLEAPFELLSSGSWVSEDLFVAELEGPQAHPAQDFGFGGHPIILGLLAMDARRGRTHVFQPTASEHWTGPRLEVRDGRWFLFASETSTTPDRIVDPAA